MRPGLLRRWRRRSRGMRVSTRLLLIIAVCLLPTTLLQLGASWSQWAERKAQLGDLATRQAELLAGNMAGIAEAARILLGAAGEVHQIRAQESACGPRLARLAQAAPGFAFLALVDAQGGIACSSDPAVLGGGTGATWVTDARNVTGFTGGRYATTPTHPGGVLPFYRPLGGEGVAGTGTLVAALDLSWLAGHLHRLQGEGSPFLASGVLTIADADGIILGRSVRHAEFVGRAVPPPAAPMLRAERPGILRMRSIDGTERVIGYTPPLPANHRLGALVGFHEPELMGDIEHTLRRGALLLGLVSAVVFALTLLVARRFIARPAQALLAVARRWREGDLAARAPDWGEGSEFGQLAAAYNGMAMALQRREEEQRSHAETLEARVAERTEALLASNRRLLTEIGERRQAESALLQAQKVQAVGQLAGGIAHDFNNILQAVSGGVALIRKRAGDPAAVERLAGMVEDAARRGTSITRRLLAFARREELRPDALDLGELLAGLQEILSATLGARIRVEVDAEPGLPAVLADRGQLETVLVNLATNARDAMPGGGSLTLSARRERVAEGQTPGLAPGDYLCLGVVDTGEGMDSVTLARAAEPFFTTKPLGQGTGLGLAMARSFAEGSGGALGIESERGQGTRILLWLPVAVPAAATGRDPAAAPPASRAPRPADGPREARLLLVDDDAMVRAVLAAQLAEAGFTVAEAADGAETLRLMGAAAGEAPFDVLVTDLAMPGMDGVALIREAQRLRPALPAILLTGYAGDVAALAVGEAIGRGAFALLRKPVTGAQLADQVAAMLDAAVPERREPAAQ
jgi:signal transduction histidine kinase/ActR/RegA family two-component response regulator